MIPTLLTATSVWILHWWDSGARRLVPNPRSRLPTSRPVWFCTSYPLAGKLGVLGLYEPSGVIANRLNDLVYGKIINLCREICVFIIEDGAVGWSCKCSSGRHCRRIGGHRSRDRARPSCSLSSADEPRDTSPAVRCTRVAALEFCVHGIVVHLRLGRDQRSSELTGNVFNPYWQGMCGPFGLFSVRVATSWAHIPRRVHPSSAVTLATFGR